METELLREKIARLEAGTPFARRTPTYTPTGWSPVIATGDPAQVRADQQPSRQLAA
jgi:hypothetical protein